MNGDREICGDLQQRKLTAAAALTTMIALKKMWNNLINLSFFNFKIRRSVSGRICIIHSDHDISHNTDKQQDQERNNNPFKI